MLATDRPRFTTIERAKLRRSTRKTHLCKITFAFAIIFKSDITFSPYLATIRHQKFDTIPS